MSFNNPNFRISAKQKSVMCFSHQDEMFVHMKYSFFIISGSEPAVVLRLRTVFLPDSVPATTETNVLYINVLLY